MVECECCGIKFESDVYVLCKRCYNEIVVTKVDNNNVSESIREHCEKVLNAFKRSGV